MKFTWTSFKKAQAAKTVGPRREVDFPKLGIEAVIAKVDTGAFSGALHATRLRETIDKTGKKSLRFCPLGSQNHVIEIDKYHKRKVKSSNGITSVRYAIDTEVSIEGNAYPITLTLANRSSMRYQLLIGRNFLRLHGFLVDVNRLSK
ncbi:MAG: ATP-dependent zinc protease [Candidatus Saccharimonadales bacterium]